MSSVPTTSRSTDNRPTLTRPTAAVRRAQSVILEIAEDLRRADRRLAEVVESLDPESAEALHEELVSVAQCVRTDLLSDAIETLYALSCRTEDEALRRRLELFDALDRLSVRAH